MASAGHRIHFFRNYGYYPYLRFNYYDQIVILLTQSHPIVDAAVINEYIGDLAMVFGAINMVMYIVGGLLVDKYGERIMLLLGGLMMAAGSVLYGLVLSKAALMAGFVLLDLAPALCGEAI